MSTNYRPVAPARVAQVLLLTSVVATVAACAPAVTSPPRAPAPTAARYAARSAGATPGDPARAPNAARGAPSIFPAGTPAAERAGAWVGRYTGGTRGGPLTLHLRERAPGDLAGELVLAVTPRASGFAERTGRTAGPTRVAVPLAGGRYEAGRLVLDTEAYYDAGCECTVTGTYRGVARGDTLTGTYATHGPATAAGVRGRWLVVRQTPTARP